MMRGVNVAVLALALSSAAVAAPSPAPKPAAAASKPKPAAPIPLAPGVRRITLSAEGRAIAQRIMSVPDPRVGQIQAEMTAIRAEKLKLVSGTSIDVDTIEPLLRREEALQSELRTRQNERLLTLLRALPDPDRLALLQNLANPAKPQSSKPAEPTR
ncbi:hypothetical protein [Sphingomonas sp. SRS2]|uniref:hypothetical protein n=1 Tax=Sphingomonas sp. SRS2 TaxID=133190 RepID=UPI0006184F1E|nr:hypothetical protein [Sphingomonas sp. SRS2]KKC27637.1 hypothetical protein WP12_02210 [Sphingomonas sp. SRS2]